MIEKVKLSLLAMQRHSWEQGVAMQAFWEYNEMDVVIALAHEAVYRSSPDGRVAMMSENEGATDPCSAGEALLHAVRATGDPALETGLARLRLWALSDAPRSDDGVCYHVTSRSEFWVDSMYMLPPFLAAIGCKAEAMHQWRRYYHTLRDPQTGLMRHIWDDGHKVFVRSAPWGVGNGWALASIARMAALVPEEQRYFASCAEDLISRLLPLLRSDGMFFDVVDDPATFPEVNLSQMLAYTLYRGMTDDWLTGLHASTAERLYQAACGQVDAYGLVRNVCGAPSFDKPGIAPEGQAFFMLMSAAREKYLNKPGGT